MGACGSSVKATPEEIARNKRVNQLLKESQGEDRPIRLLLLGSGNSGKSTFLKQFKRLYVEEGFTENERRRFCPDIHRNVVRDILILTEAVNFLQGTQKVPLDGVDKLVNSSLASFFDRSRQECMLTDVLEVNTDEGTVHMKVVDAVKRLWSTESVQQAFLNEGEIKDLEGNTGFWMDILDEVATEGFLPTVDHLLNIRSRTVGIATLAFKYASADLTAIDVGGQRNERKKWIMHFDDVDAIMFICSGAEFDKVLLEDGITNRMVEGVNLFEEMVKCPYFVESK